MDVIQQSNKEKFLRRVKEAQAAGVPYLAVTITMQAFKKNEERRQFYDNLEEILKEENERG